MAATTKVYEILHDIDGDGPACDGTAIQRFSGRSKAEALAFAASHTLYGRPCKVPEPRDVPRRLAARWGV